MLDKFIKKFTSGVSSGTPDEVEKKQKVIKLIGVIGLGAILVIFMFSGNDDKKVVEKPEDLKIYTDTMAAQSGYVGKVAPQVQSVIEQNKLIAQQDKDLKEKLAEMQQTLEVLKKGGSPTGVDPAMGFPSATNGPEKGKDAAAMLGMTPGVVPTPPAEGFNAPQKRVVQKNDEIKDSLAIEDVKKDESIKKNDQSEKLKTGINSKKPFIPTGSITKAVLLNGIYAPTMTKAKTTPLPVLMRMTDLSIIPNRKKFNIRECFMLGEGYGELASERVHIRLTTISCVTAKNDIIDVDAKGFVAGEDGVTGLAGKVISKQGALLGRTIVAGFLQGVGQSFSQANQTMMMSPLGTTTGTTDLSPSALAQAGAFKGGAVAAQKLADFYLKMADSIEPVIEISAGRSVDVVITKGMELRTREDLARDKDKQQISGQASAQHVDSVPMSTPQVAPEQITN